MSKRGGKKRRYTGLLVFLIVVLVLCSVSIIILGILLYQKKVLADRGPSLPQIQSSVSTEETIKEMSTEAVIDEMTSQTEESVETASETAVQALEKPENPDAIIDLSTALYSYQKMENDLQLLAGYYPQYMHLIQLVSPRLMAEFVVIYFGNQNASRQIFYMCGNTCT